MRIITDNITIDELKEMSKKMFGNLVKAVVDVEKEIMAVDGVDILFIGPYDLSQSVGVPGEVNHPLVLQQMEKVIATAKSAGKLVGTFADDIQSAQRWMKAGVMYIAISVDVGIFYNACKDIVTSLSK